MPHFDLIIVGTGVAGRTAAEEAARLGLSTAVVDRREFGGTCALRGCEPKKILAAAAEAALRVRGQRGHGLAGDAHVDWGELVAFKRLFTVDLPREFEEGMRAVGQTPLHGVARFSAPDTLEVDGVAYTAEAFFLGTGDRPGPLGIPGEELVIDSEAFMELPAIPERVAFLGGGYISFEFAGMAAAAGARPVILHRSEQALKGFDPDLVTTLIAQYAEWGIEVRLNAPVAGVRRCAPDRGSPLAVVLGDGSEVPADLVVHGAGRVPDLDALDLAAAGVDAGPRGIAVDTTMRSTSNPRAWAAGDSAALGPALTPVAIAQARVALANIAAPGSARYEPLLVPSVAFSQPPLASVGMHEADAMASGLDVAVELTDTSGWLSSQRVGLSHTGAKTLVERSTGRVLGAHLLGHGAEEVVNLFALAIARGLTVSELKAMLWAYPTASSEIVYLI